MHCTFWLCLYFLLVARATNITTDNPSTTPIPVASSLHFSFPAFSTIHFESGIHPCLNRVNYAFLAIQGHICRVTHSYKHVSPWVSLLLILSGDVSISPGPNTSLLTGSLINIRSIINKSVALADFINSNRSDFIVITETWLQPDDTDSFIASVTPLGYKCTHVPRLEGRAGGVGSSSVMTLILRSYLNRVSILLSPYLFTYPWAMPRTLFFILCIGPPMFPKPISLRMSVPSSKVLLYHVVKI